MAPAITVTSDSDSVKESAAEGPALEAANGAPAVAGGAASEEPLLAEDELLQMLMEDGGREGAGGGAFHLFNAAELLAAPAPAAEDDEPRPEAQLREVLERQHALQRRYDRLLRLIRRKQARSLGFHAGLQIYEMVTTTKAYVKARSAALRLHSATDDLLDADHVNGMSPKALASLVKQMATPGTASGSMAMAAGPRLAETLSCEQAAVLSSGSGQLSQRLRHVEAELDSDVTASSSGGDSCDESAGFSVHNAHQRPICKRAAWRFARERASAASRWSWLMANIAELEYRIRQLVDYQRQLRTNKGPIVFAPASSKDGEKSLPNGLEEEESACRVKPLDLSTFRKRKLFVPGMLTPKTGKRVCQPQTQPPCCRDTCSMPCVLCFPKKPTAGMQQQPLLPPDVGGRETLRERAARLDPAIHPVLSSSQDVSRSLQMAALLRQPGWQQSQLRHRGLARLGLKKTRLPVPPPPPDSAPNKRKYKKASSAASALSAKLRKKAKAAKKKVKRMENALKKRPPRDDSNNKASGGGDEPQSEAALLAAQAAAQALRQVRKKRESSYDIDNIVIPYSMAALTRVEKLEYKEILTPKWRVSEIVPVGKKANHKRTPSVDDSEVEDISDEAVVQRHEPLEMEERKKFRCAPRNAQRGGVRARRTDSRAESSGANTPDPMSPKEAEESPMTSPRATPLPFGEAGEAGRKARRRTISLQAPCELPAPPPVPEEVQAPFEPRVFPLTEEQCRLMADDETHRTPAPRKITLVPPEYESCGGAAPASPCSSDSTESALPEDDPEWTLEEPSDEDPGAAATDPTFRPRRSQ